MTWTSQPGHAALRSHFLSRKGKFASFVATRIGASQVRDGNLGRRGVRVNWAAGETLWTKARQQRLLQPGLDWLAQLEVRPAMGQTGRRSRSSNGTPGRRMNTTKMAPATMPPMWAHQAT